MTRETSQQPLLIAVGAIAVASLAVVWVLRPGAPAPAPGPAPAEPAPAEAAPSPCTWAAGEAVAVAGRYDMQLAGEYAQLLDEHHTTDDLKVSVSWRFDAVARPGHLKHETWLVGWWTAKNEEGEAEAVAARVRVKDSCRVVAIGTSEAPADNEDMVRQTLMGLSFVEPGLEPRSAQHKDGLRWVREGAQVRARKREASRGSVSTERVEVQRPAETPWFSSLLSLNESRVEMGKLVSRQSMTARVVAPQTSRKGPKLAAWREHPQRRAERADPKTDKELNPEGLDLAKLGVDDIMAYRRRMQRKGWNSAKRNDLLEAWLRANPQHVTDLMKAIDDRKLSTQWEYTDALSCLARTGDERAMRKLRGYINDPNAHAQLRAQAVTSMIFDRPVPPPGIVDDFVRVSAETSDWPGQRVTQQLAMTTLGTVVKRHGATHPQIAAKAKKAVLDRLADPAATPHQTKAAMMAAGNAQDPELVAATAGFRRSGDVEIRTEAWNTLRGLTLEALLEQFPALKAEAGGDRVKRTLLYRVIADKLVRSGQPPSPALLSAAMTELKKAPVPAGEVELLDTLINIVGLAAKHDQDPAARALLQAVCLKAVKAKNTSAVEAAVRWLGKGAAALK